MYQYSYGQVGGNRCTYFIMLTYTTHKELKKLSRIETVKFYKKKFTITLKACDLAVVVVPTINEEIREYIVATDGVKAVACCLNIRVVLH